MRLTYRYSNHGRRRARGRSITREEIDQALNNPEWTEPGNAPDRPTMLQERRTRLVGLLR